MRGCVLWWEIAASVVLLRDLRIHGNRYVLWWNISKLKWSLDHQTACRRMAFVKHAALAVLPWALALASCINPFATSWKTSWRSLFRHTVQQLDRFAMSKSMARLVMLGMRCNSCNQSDLKSTPSPPISQRQHRVGGRSITMTSRLGAS